MDIFVQAREPNGANTTWTKVLAYTTTSDQSVAQEFVDAFKPIKCLYNMVRIRGWKKEGNNGQPIMNSREMREKFEVVNYEVNWFFKFYNCKFNSLNFKNQLTNIQEVFKI